MGMGVRPVAKKAKRPKLSFTADGEKKEGKTGILAGGEARKEKVGPGGKMPKLDYFLSKGRGADPREDGGKRMQKKTKKGRGNMKREILKANCEQKRTTTTGGEEKQRDAR